MASMRDEKKTKVISIPISESLQRALEIASLLYGGGQSTTEYCRQLLTEHAEKCVADVRLAAGMLDD